MNNICPCHHIIHKPDDQTLHQYCVRHGHCLNPIQCTAFVYCPIPVYCHFHKSSHDKFNLVDHDMCFNKCQHHKKCSISHFCPLNTSHK